MSDHIHRLSDFIEDQAQLTETLAGLAESHGDESLAYATAQVLGIKFLREILDTFEREQEEVRQVIAAGVAVFEGAQ